MELETILLICGLILTVISFSYPFFGVSRPFSFAEHLGIGGTTAVAMITMYGTFRGFITTAGSGSPSLFIPIIVGALVFARLTKYQWLANYPIAIMAGTGIGLVFGTTITKDIISQLTATISDLASANPDPFSSALMFFTVAFTILYFFYSRKISNEIHGGRARIVGRIARLLLFATFGNLYAKVLIYDGLDYGLTAYLTSYVRRTIDQILIAFGSSLPF